MNSLINNVSVLTQLNLTDVADRHGYRSFYKLLQVRPRPQAVIGQTRSCGADGSCVFQDTGVVDLLSDGTTVFMPSDAVMASLPQQQRDFLFHPDHRPQLVEYLKYHVLQGQRVSPVQTLTTLFKHQQVVVTQTRFHVTTHR